MSEYTEAVREFYRVLGQIRKEYSLLVNTRLSTSQGNYVKIYKTREGMPKKLVIKAEEEDEILCFRKATQELITWNQNRQQMKEQREVG